MSAAQVEARFHYRDLGSEDLHFASSLRSRSIALLSLVMLVRSLSYARYNSCLQPLREAYDV